MIRKLAKRLEDYQPKSSDEKLPQAAVLILCYEKGDDLFYNDREVKLFTKPSWRGSFRGGKKEEQDQNLMYTALREAAEEISINPDKVKILGNLDPLESRFGLSVTPYIGVLGENFELQANPDEVAEIFHLPLSFFKNEPSIKRGVTNFKGETFDTPVIIYENHEIWGLTLAFTLDFLKLFNIKFKDDLQIW